jgi:hypothetical protein
LRWSKYVSVVPPLVLAKQFEVYVGRYGRESVFEDFTRE